MSNTQLTAVERETVAQMQAWGAPSRSCMADTVRAAGRWPVCYDFVFLDSRMRVNPSRVSATCSKRAI